MMKIFKILLWLFIFAMTALVWEGEGTAASRMMVNSHNNSALCTATIDAVK